MNQIQSDTARAMNTDFLTKITRAVDLANRLDDLGEPFPIIGDVPRYTLQDVVAAMEASLAEIEECEEITIRVPKMDECEFILTCEPEYDSPEGHFASGDDDQDAEDVARIIADSQWNEWAWCCAKVECNWRGITGVDYLGGCNYASEEDFREDGYFEDMKDAAYRDLLQQIEALGGKEVLP